MPSSATLTSFFVIFIIMLLFTCLLGVNLPILFAGFHTIRHHFQKDDPSASSQGLLQSLKVSAYKFGSIPYVRWYIDVLDPAVELRTCVEYWPERERRRDLEQQSRLHMDLSDFFWVLWRPFKWPRTVPIFLLRYCCVPEILYPKFQLWLLQRVGRKYLYYSIKWYPPLILVDIIRFCLIPVWIALAAVLLACLMVEDMLVAPYNWIFHRHN
jgi:hypothetical protein